MAVSVELTVWPGGPATGARNMALDEAAMKSARRGALALRLYSWEPGCISLGRNQPTGGRLDGRPHDEFVPGEDVVRRPTGGRSVFHGPELTYAVALPERLLGGPRATYRAIHAALARALGQVGARLDPDVAEVGGPRTPGVGPPLDLAECFVAPAPGEITVGGRKLVGSAQWRHRGAILQHGSILLRNEQRRATVSGEGGAAAIGLDEALATPVSLETVTAAVAESLGCLAGHVSSRSEPRVDELEAVAALEARYRSPEWTWRQ